MTTAFVPVQALGENGLRTYVPAVTSCTKVDHDEKLQHNRR